MGSIEFPVWVHSNVLLRLLAGSFNLCKRQLAGPFSVVLKIILSWHTDKNYNLISSVSTFFSSAFPSTLQDDCPGIKEGHLFITPAIKGNTPITHHSPFVINPAIIIAAPITILKILPVSKLNLFLCYGMRCNQS